MKVEEKSTLKLGYFACLLAAAFLAACTAFTIGDANKLQKGMAPSQVLDLVSKGPEKTFEISLPSDPTRKFSVMEFEMKIGDVKANYYAVYENNKLYYWGFPYEFNRYPDLMMNELGRVAVETSKNM